MTSAGMRAHWHAGMTPRFEAYAVATVTEVGVTTLQDESCSYPVSETTRSCGIHPAVGVPRSASVVLRAPQGVAGGHGGCPPIPSSLLEAEQRVSDAQAVEASS